MNVTELYEKRTRPNGFLPLQYTGELPNVRREQ